MNAPFLHTTDTARPEARVAVPFGSIIITPGLRRATTSCLGPTQPSPVSTYIGRWFAFFLHDAIIIGKICQRQCLFLSIPHILSTHDIIIILQHHPGGRAFVRRRDVFRHSILCQFCDCDGAFLGRLYQEART